MSAFGAGVFLLLPHTSNRMSIPYVALYEGGVKEAYVVDASTSGSGMRHVNVCPPGLVSLAALIRSSCYSSSFYCPLHIACCR